MRIAETMKSVAAASLVVVASVAAAIPAHAATTPTSTTSTATSTKIGGTISDSATVSAGLLAPSPTGTVTFKLYAPGDTGCATAIATFTKPLSNGSASTGPYTPTTLGVYRWIASYSGDATNAASAGKCNATNESSTVSQATPGVTTTAVATANLGQAINDKATLTASSLGAVPPGGSVIFTAYGPNDTLCRNPAPFVSSSVPVTASGTAQSSDFVPSTPGTYRWVAKYSGDTNNAGATGACNDANESSSVGTATPSISTTATANASLGQPISDTATLTSTSAPNPQPTGTITFSAYGPNNATCSGVAAFTSVKSVSSNGPIASAAYTPTAIGVYRWIASYGGDNNNAAVTGHCNDANESSAVKAATTISSKATATATGSAPISDSATLANTSSATAAPTGTITFNLYNSSDTACSGAVIFSSTKSVTSNGPITSDPWTPTGTGTFRWIASYSGDANNAAVTGHCNDPNEASTVNAAGANLTSAASSGVVGNAIHDVVTLSGGQSPTGSITFNLFGPNDPNCGAASLQSTSVTVTGNGTYTSPNYTAGTSGNYRWTASYSGDGTNHSASNSCGTSGSVSTVSKATPTLTTSASGGTGSTSDSATLASGYNPTGSITFNLYGPNDSTCSAGIVHSSTATVNGNGTYASGSYSPSSGGSYRWIAIYSGDANNSEVSGSCSDGSETATVGSGGGGSQNPAPRLTDTSSGGSATLIATTSPQYSGAYFRYYVRSGMTGKVRSLGLAYVNSQGVASRFLGNLRVGQHMRCYAKLSVSDNISSPYTNDVALTVH